LVCWQSCSIRRYTSSFRIPHHQNLVNMGWGVLDDRHMAAPPGTAKLGIEENTGMATPEV
jgi:hypothetical protein